MRKRPLLVVMLLLLGLSLPAQAQRITASVRGTIMDETGGVLPGASVTISGPETGFTRTVVANASGVYTFGDVPVGTYEISVELDGFKTAIVTDIVLNVADTTQIDVKLELGAIAEEVTTTANSIRVETIGGEVTGLVEGEQIRELPLNGRNFVQLTQLMPGISTADSFNTKNKGLLTGVDMSVSGSAVTNNLWTVDGANNNDVGSNRTILVYPSVDSIEEFKIHRNSYGAEFGGAAGAQINLVTRGGTNKYRGSFAYFRRDDSWNEPNFFLEQAGQDTEPLERDDFNWTVGGPIVKDKLHFFFSQELNDEVRGVARSSLVPTLAERNGDFSGSSIPGCTPPVPIDPLTGAPFPGNVIPADRLSDGGLAYLQLYPLPNTTPVAGTCNNWVAAVSTPIEFKQLNGRLDWSLNDKTRLMFRATQDDWTNNAPNGGGENGLWGDDPFPAVDSNWEQPSFSVTAQLNQTIGATAVNTVQLSYTGNEITITRGGENVGLSQTINDAIPAIFPDDGKTTGSDGSHPVFWGGQGYQPLWNIAPWENKQDLLILKDDYQQVFGKHWIKAGINVSQNKKNENVGSSSDEAPQFWGAAGINGWGATTGNVLADFLLRDMTWGFSENATNPNSRIRWEDLELYVSDSWQVHPRVSVDFGLRYSRFYEPYSEDDLIASFRPDLFDPALGNSPCNGLVLPPSMADACAQLGFAGATVADNRSLVDKDTDNIAPRFGLAWDVFGDGKSALRAGIGQFFQRNRVSFSLVQAANPPFNSSQSGIRTLDSNEEPCPGCFSSAFGFPTRGIVADLPTPYEIHWNLTWEQQLRPNTTIEVGYIGSRGVHLTRRSDINQVPDGDANGNGINDRLEWVQAANNLGRRGELRPFSAFGDNTIVLWENDGKSIYHSLQAHFVTRFGRGSHFQASYTWSRSKANDPLTDSGAGTFPGMITDRDDLGLDWGLSGIHREHIANASLVYNLPTLEGKGGAMQSIFGNWQVGTIVLWSTGTPITVYTGTIPGVGGGAAGTGFTDNQRPNLTGDPCDASGGPANAILNPNAFTLTGLQLGQNGNARRGVCIGPDYFQVDLSLYKNIRLGRHVNAQLRFEVFNLFDRDNFWQVNNVMNPVSVTLDGPVESATQITDYTLPLSFGQATRARDPRQVQIGIRLTFE